jgi:hypothetical protein
MKRFSRDVCLKALTRRISKELVDNIKMNIIERNMFAAKSKMASTLNIKQFYFRGGVEITLSFHIISFKIWDISVSTVTSYGL